MSSDQDKSLSPENNQAAAIFNISQENLRIKSEICHDDLEENGHEEQNINVETD